MRFTDKYKNTYLITNINLSGCFVQANCFNEKNEEYKASICFSEFTNNDKYDLSDCQDLVIFLKSIEKNSFGDMLSELNKVVD